MSVLWPCPTEGLAQEPRLLILKGPDYSFLLTCSLPSLETPGSYLLPYHLITMGPQSSVLPVMGKSQLAHFRYASE